MMSEEKTSFVLYPDGAPRFDVGRAACARIVEYMCGPIERTCEGPFADREALSKTIVDLLRSTDEAANRGVVVLTELANLPLGVIRLRRELQNTHSRLISMLWVLFVEQQEHPFFPEEAARFGRLDAELDDVPVWAAEGQRYVVLTPRSEPMLAKQRARQVVPSSGYFKATRPEGIRRPDLSGIVSARSRPRGGDDS